MKIVDIHDPGFFSWFRARPRQTRDRGNPGTKQKRVYLDCISAFDIETTLLDDGQNSIMYIWMWAFDGEYCVIGRTWEEFLSFQDSLSVHLKKGEYLVSWVHNLSFEFAFLRGIWRFAPDDVFAVKSRRILKCKLNRIEFRDSYLHTNMSLGEFLRKMGVEHKKLTLDYSKKRYPWTPLDEDELAYCINDVVGLVEAIRIEMDHDGDNLYSIPLTSTGYVRRDAKRAMREGSYTQVQSQLPDYPIYQELREAFRGGDTHANRYYVEQVVYDLHSADRSSSYPDVACNELFPMSAFYQLTGVQSWAEVQKLMLVRKKALLMRVAITGLRLRDYQWPCPYISRDKSRCLVNACYDNGRVLMADYLELTITDVDLRIISREYTWDDIVFFDVAYARYGPLPEALISEIIKYYKAKTELKNVEGYELYYLKSKNKLNAFYGMMAQNPCKRNIIYTQDGVIDKYGIVDYYPEDESIPDADILKKHNKTAFLVYQWGCWITAWARYRLHEAIWEIIDQGGEFIYCDTDSVKYFGDVDFSAYNNARIAASKKSGAFAADPHGEVHYMGVLEAEHDMLAFSTMGAKKYIYVDVQAGEPVLCCTIAGVAKEAGAVELAQHGGMSAFREGFTFVEAGGLEARYNDNPPAQLTEVDGHMIRITANVSLVPSTYTLGYAADYRRLLDGLNFAVDNLIEL